MKAMIFAAGLGTLLRPLTDRMPKALVPVGGRPLLEILVGKLQREGFDDIIVNVHHFAEQIVEWSKGRNGIRLSDESAKLLETGGGIRHARPLLADCERFLIHNVDILSNARLKDFFDAGTGKEAMLMVSERDTSRYLLFSNDMRLMGWTNIATGEVRSPHNGLDPSRCRKLAFAGIHQMSTKLFPLMDAWPERFSIIDFYLEICKERDIYGYIQPDLRLMDVGKIDSLAKAGDWVI